MEVEDWNGDEVKGLESMVVCSASVVTFRNVLNIILSTTITN